MILNEKKTICWSCKKACGSCSWSSKFKPVEGWTAIPTFIKMQYGGKDASYIVLKCPEYEKG